MHSCELFINMSITLRLDYRRGLEVMQCWWFKIMRQELCSKGYIWHWQRALAR